MHAKVMQQLIWKRWLKYTVVIGTDEVKKHYYYVIRSRIINVNFHFFILTSHDLQKSLSFAKKDRGRERQNPHTVRRDLSKEREINKGKPSD